MVAGRKHQYKNSDLNSVLGTEFRSLVLGHVMERIRLTRLAGVTVVFGCKVLRFKIRIMNARLARDIRVVACFVWNCWRK